MIKALQTSKVTLIRLICILTRKDRNNGKFVQK